MEIKLPKDTQVIPISYLHCHTCNKQVSTGFFAVPTQTPDRGIIVRAYIECPECIEKSVDNLRKINEN